VDYPLVGPAGQIGVLRLQFTEPAPWSEHEHDVLAAFANLLALAVENARSYTEARHAASHDALTDLGNRRILFSQGTRILAHDTETGSTVALLLVDLDRFKEVNDTLGHSAGDRLLRGVAERLRRSVRADDLVARIGGDEFAVVLRGLADAEAAESVAGSLGRALARPISVDGVSLAVEASIGLACFPADGDTVEELLRRADVALYQAKQAGCGHRRYRAADDPSTLDQLALVADLHSALADGDVGLRYSPRLDLATGTVTAIEALPHWEHARLGPLPRWRFLAPAGRSALAGALTRRVLDLALRSCAGWRAEGHRVRVCVRLFPRNLLEPDLARDVAQLLVRHRVPADALVITVPAVALAGGTAATAHVAALRRLGLGLCLSGEGIASAEASVDWLTESASGLDEIELGAAVVAGLTSQTRSGRASVPTAARSSFLAPRSLPAPGHAGPGAASPAGPSTPAGPTVSVARAVVGLAHELGLHVVAHGADTLATLTALVALGCDAAHGLVAERRTGPDVGASAGHRPGADHGHGLVAGDGPATEPSSRTAWGAGRDPDPGLDANAIHDLLGSPALPVGRLAPVLELAGARRARHIH
jgi:diguanylate cyclase (GGDEF)-like protein